MKLKRFLILMLAAICLFSLTANAASSKSTAAEEEVEEESEEESLIDVSKIDLSELSFDELVELKDRINLAIWESEEWEEVTVPQGRWIVGEDIPAGKWTIKCSDINLSAYAMKETWVQWGFEKNDGSIDTYSRNGGGSEEIYQPDHKDYKDGQNTEITVELEEGMSVEVITFCAPAVFSPYSGKPSLQFRNNDD